MQITDWAYRLNNMRVIGLPLQFVIVVVMSLGLTIFFGAWAADARIEARNQPFAQTEAGSSQFDFAAHPNADLSGSLEGTAAGSEQGWERAFLFACPLH